MKRKGALRPYSSSPCMAHELDEPLAVKAKAIRIKRIYDDVTKADGYRVLVDRLWPRGITKKSAALDEWARDVTPTAQLRKAYHGESITWAQFRTLYRAELRKHSTDLTALKRRAGSRTVTLLTASREPKFNHAVVLKEALEALG